MLITFASDVQQSYIVTSPEYSFDIPISGSSGFILKHIFRSISAIEKAIEVDEGELQVLAVEYKNVEQVLLPKIINV